MGMDTFYGDTFDNGFGSFETVKRAHPQSKPLYRCESINFHLKIESQAMFSVGYKMIHSYEVCPCINLF